MGTYLRVSACSRRRLFDQLLDRVGAYSGGALIRRGALIQGFRVVVINLFSRKGTMQR